MKKYKIGYTAGVFDMFHVGHLNILKKAKEHCDYLIVGVNTDEFVQSYKNKTPVIPFNERIEIIKAIKYVDRVVVQDTNDKLSMWEKYHFDAVFIGDDWKHTKVYIDNEEKLKSVGCDVVYFEYTKGISSTMLRELIKNMS